MCLSYLKATKPGIDLLAMCDFFSTAFVTHYICMENTVWISAVYPVLSELLPPVLWLFYLYLFAFTLKRFWIEIILIIFQFLLILYWALPYFLSFSVKRITLICAILISFYHNEARNFIRNELPNKIAPPPAIFTQKGTIFFLVEVLIFWGYTLSFGSFQFFMNIFLLFFLYCAAIFFKKLDTICMYCLQLRRQAKRITKRTTLKLGDTK